MVLIAAGATTAAAAPMVVLYATPATNRAIVRPGAADALHLNGRLFVQEPNVGHLFAGDSDRPYRLSRVTAEQIVQAGSAQAIAGLLRDHIAASNCSFAGSGRAGCRSHLVFIDEIDARFAERAPNLKTPAWRGRTSRGQKKRAFPNYVPRPRPGQPGYELGKAMEILAALPFPGGGTYADRAHFYIAPGLVSSLGIGRGKYHNLGRDRRPHFRTYEGLRTALQRAGGVWLEMYHFDTATRTHSPFTTREWMTHPTRFTRYLTAPGAAADPALIAKVRFMMSRGAPRAHATAPAVCQNAAQPQTCQFALASLPQNAPILANGVGQYRMEGDEAEWRAHVKRLFFP